MLETHLPEEAEMGNPNDGLDEDDKNEDDKSETGMSLPDTSFCRMETEQSWPTWTAPCELTEDGPGMAIVSFGSSGLTEQVDTTPLVPMPWPIAWPGFFDVKCASTPAMMPMCMWPTSNLAHPTPGGEAKDFQEPGKGSTRSTKRVGGRKNVSLIDLAAKNVSLIDLAAKLQRDQQDSHKQATKQDDSQKQASKPQARFCTYCGGSILPSFKFCQCCGAKIASAHQKE